MSAPRVVVVLGGVFPIPPEAGTPRPYHLLTRLSRRAEVLAVIVLPELEPRADSFLQRSELTRLFGEVHVHRRLGRHSLTARLRNLIAGRAALELAYRDPEAIASVHATVRDLARRRGPVVFYCYGMSSLQFVPEEFWDSCMLDAVDAASMALERRLRADAALGLRERAVLAVGLPGLRRYERRILPRVAAASYNSSVDLAYVGARCPGARLHRVIDGADVEYFAPGAAGQMQERPEEIVFFGHMAFPPNADAALHLVREVMPRVWARTPSARVVLIGPEPSAALRSLGEDERVEVTGFVDDIRPYLERATVVASPLRFGAGMKNKLQAGLAMEKAMVVSTVTCEGFDELESGRHAIIADDPEDFAGAICELLADPDRRRALGTAGRELIRRSYSWEAADQALWEALSVCTPVGGPAPGSQGGG